MSSDQSSDRITPDDDPSWASYAQTILALGPDLVTQIDLRASLTPADHAAKVGRSPGARYQRVHPATRCSSGDRPRREAALLAAGLFQAAQESRYPANAAQAADVRTAAEGINADQLLLRQTPAVQRFFDSAAAALRGMRAANPAPPPCDALRAPPVRRGRVPELVVEHQGVGLFDVNRVIVGLGWRRWGTR